ncbi:MAG: AcvB/VirJ family lysyl-phosphatidylglycerol hydrolase [Sphingobium sp.]
MPAQARMAQGTGMADGSASMGAGRWRAWRAAFAILAIFAAAGLAWLAFLGAFDHDVYHDLPASGGWSHGHGEVAAVLLSGDMGFRIGMGPDVARRLAEAGIPVTGVNSLAAFRHRRGPARIGRVIEAAMDHARARTGARRLVLIGQSFGADMLHVGLAALPPEKRRDILLVALVVPTDTVYYQVSLGETFEWTAPDAAAIDTARRLDWVPVLCIQGKEESNSLCPRLDRSNMRRVALPGGHPLHRDADAVARVLLDAIRQVVRW